MYPDANESENPVLDSLTELKIKMVSTCGELDKSPVNVCRRIRLVQVRIHESQDWGGRNVSSMTL